MLKIGRVTTNNCTLENSQLCCLVKGDYREFMRGTLAINRLMKNKNGTFFLCFYPKICKLGPDDCVNLNQLVFGTHLYIWELTSVAKRLPKTSRMLTALTLLVK